MKIEADKVIEKLAKRIADLEKIVAIQSVQIECLKEVGGKQDE